MRSVPEWIGKDDDERPPARVRLRVFERYGGVCQLSKRRIMAGERWEADHRIAIGCGGQNRESNLWPVLVEPHREKTADDRGRQSKIERTRQKHLGIYPKSKRPLQGRGFEATRRFEGD